MKGTRPLDNDEIRRVSGCFTGTFTTRNRGLFMLGVSTGGRISELLSLRIGDVYQNGKAVSDLLYNKKIVKGGEVSRAVPVNVDGRDAIEALIGWHREKYATIAPSRPLFPSRNKSGTVAMNRQTAHDMLKEAFMDAGLNGKLATHSLRKSFAQRVYEQSGDIYLVQELLGHRNVATTQKYIGVNYATAREAVEAIALGAEPYRTALLSGSFRFLGGELKQTADETLFLELALRGYDLSSLRENDEAETPAEIVQIG
ncbi:MAG: site-specific integrase [Candidatus Poribacteria bacterium]|nr:site-specific integrase [Candidatus Poribacteria bacterium]